MSGRHLSLPILLQHLASRVPVAYPFPGDPAVLLTIDGSRPSLTLRAKTAAAEGAGAAHLANVRAQLVSIAGDSYMQVSVVGESLLLDGHGMLCAIADRIQLEDAEPWAAFDQTLAQWHQILAIRSRLDREAEVGLFGELLLLHAVVSVHGTVTASSWRGALREEHDFGFEDEDLEVKTTTREDRVHAIHGLGQLTATPGRPLFLLSLQITSGGNAGSTLTELVAGVRDVVGTEIDDGLRRSGWASDAADLYSERWVLRSAPKVYAIDGGFPALTRSRVDQIDDAMVAVERVDYWVRCDALDGSGQPPAHLQSVLGHMTKELLS